MNPSRTIGGLAMIMGYNIYMILVHLYTAIEAIILILLANISHKNKKNSHIINFNVKKSNKIIVLAQDKLKIKHNVVYYALNDLLEVK